MFFSKPGPLTAKLACHQKACLRFFPRESGFEQCRFWALFLWSLIGHAVVAQKPKLLKPYFSAGTWVWEVLGSMGPFWAPVWGPTSSFFWFFLLLLFCWFWFVLVFCFVVIYVGDVVDFLLLICCFWFVVVFGDRLFFFIMIIIFFFCLFFSSSSSLYSSYCCCSCSCSAKACFCFSCFGFVLLV